MEDYPRNLPEFEARFSTEEACRNYLFGMRWPERFTCPQCAGPKAWPLNRLAFECASCGHQASVIAGTIFHGTHKPLTLWFRAIWLVTSQKTGASALGLQRVLGLGSYKTAWTWLQEKFDRPVRLVEVHVAERPPRGLKCPVKKVSSKKGFRRPLGQAYTLLIATDRLDLPADVIALIYQHRWKVELFFRLLKSVLGCRHLLSDSIEGVSVQVYCALIASLLLAESTGIKPGKRTYELFALYLQGWVEDDELARELAKLRALAGSKRA